MPAWLAGPGDLFLRRPGLRRASAARSETLDLILTTLRANFRFSPLLLLPMAVIFYFAVAKKPTIPAMVLSSLVAAALAVLVQKDPVDGRGDGHELRALRPGPASRSSTGCWPRAA
ncbi:MAG: hypothetical protein MZV64_12630 [Ignavibacteriales bacterium]|nr:hypothetical protein [Ignavibacteriales bacterium]